MTKKLEELLNLPDSKEIVDEAKAEDKKTKKETTIVEIAETQRDIQELDKIASALPRVKGLGDKADEELEDIAKKALDAYEDLMDLGMNVEARFSGEIFGNAARMLDTALSAKSQKINKKLRMVDLQLKKATLDARLAREAAARGEDTQEGDGQIVDRNQLLMEILGRNTSEK